MRMSVIEMCSENDSGYQVIGSLPPKLRRRIKLFHLILTLLDKLKFA